MGLFSSLAGIFKASEAPKEEKEVSDCCSGGQCTCGVSSIEEEEASEFFPLSSCCANGQCTCGESSSIEDEDTTASITVTNTTTTATSNTSDDVANITVSASGNVNPTSITEAASITKLRPAVKNEVTTETGDGNSKLTTGYLQVEESSTEEESVQLEFDLSDAVGAEVPAPVVTTAATPSSSTASTRNNTRKSKAKRGKKKKK